MRFGERYMMQRANLGSSSTSVAVLANMGNNRVAKCRLADMFDPGIREKIQKAPQHMKYDISALRGVNDVLAVKLNTPNWVTMLVTHDEMETIEKVNLDTAAGGSPVKPVKFSDTDPFQGIQGAEPDLAQHLAVLDPLFDENTRNCIRFTLFMGQMGQGDVQHAQILMGIFDKMLKRKFNKSFQDIIPAKAPDVPVLKSSASPKMTVSQEVLATLNSLRIGKTGE